MSTPWSEEDIATAKRVLGRHRSPGTALQEIGYALGRGVTYDSLKTAFRARGLTPLSQWCAEDEPPTVRRYGSVTSADSASYMQPSQVDVSVDVRRLVDVSKKKPLPFEDLCDVLDVSPRKCRELIEAAQQQGYHVEANAGHVGFRVPPPDERVRETGIAPIVGERQIVGVISDTHLGSKYCLREQLKDFVHTAYERGVREILHPGDVLDGCYRHGLWEVSHSGLDAQAEDLFETLPRLPGLTYHAIEGNHDNTFTDSIGLSTGRFLEGFFRHRGRDDLRFYGNRGAFLRVRGAVVHLWHPRSGQSYARSYALQKHVEKYSSGEKPHILLAGHWHVYCHVFERGVHAIACPTFQGGGSAFSKSLGGAPAMGGLLLSWGLTEHGTMRDFSLEYRAYFEREQPQVLFEGAA